MKKGNPLITNALNLSKDKVDGGVMTVGGAIVKSFILMAVVAASFLYSYSTTIYTYKSILAVAGVIAFIAAMVTIFMPKIARFTAIIDRKSVV